MELSECLGGVVRRDFVAGHKVTFAGDRIGNPATRTGLEIGCTYSLFIFNVMRRNESADNYKENI